MATLSDVWSRLFAHGMERTTERVRGSDASTRVRPFLNEDVLFYVKRIDNSGVVLIGVLMPSAYGLMAGYQIQSLRLEGQRLATDRASLELKEAELLSPARMEELARQQQFVDPAPQKVVYLEGQQGSLAMNKK
jgi:hypothetical protein